ncbi:hypothetical protein JKI95_10235 [Corynebacterium aquatimens]|uniref:hypothetical protein n=1 Tax=Corynebacterium TaxID=1716 RepID=UPI001F2AB7C4|nr:MULTISPECIES: hypothetical protein [Corynebacterium]QYH19449.1 hypothetical protein JKI95_10235 [Corynebacterium aquatimens]UIZ91630.1 hypothetical protein JZY91_07715 [Corynebacterium sp. CNCTC7651]
MAVHMTIDLADATFADLVALVEAARVAGVERSTPVTLEDSTLTVAVEPAPQPAPRPAERPAESDAAHRPLPQLGDAAIRSVVDILTGRQEPPRR